MATADIEEYVSERDWGHTLFSKQYCGQLVIQVVKIEGVVQKFIDSRTISEAERKSLRDKKVADQKLRRLLTIITDHCNRDDLQAFKTFIDILGDTNNVDIGKQLSLIYKERVNHVATLSRLSKEKSLVGNLNNEISNVQSIMEKKERYLISVKCEKEKLVDHYRKVADDQTNELREEKLSLEKKIKKINADFLFVEKEIGDLTRAKHDLENEVELKSNDIRKTDKEIVEKEQDVRKAIEESNFLRHQIDALLQQDNKAIVKNKELSNKIEILEDELAEKENTIMNLRKKLAITGEKIAIRHDEKLDRQTEMMKKQNEQIDSLKAIAIQQNKQIDSLTASSKQQVKPQQPAIDCG